MRASTRRLLRHVFRHAPAVPRPVRTEALEGRTLLAGVGAAEDAAARDAAVQFFDASDAVFVENRGQWADASVKYAYNGQGINVGFTDTGPVLEVMRERSAHRRRQQCR